MRFSILLSLVTLFGYCNVGESREWVDRTGKFKTTADLVEVKGGNVVLKKSDGKQITVPIARLSDKDQAYLRQQMAKEADTSVSDSAEAADAGPAEAPKGTLFGEPFEAAVIEMQGNTITFASDDEFFPAQSILLFLFADDEKLAGQKFVVTGRGRGQSPHIHIKSKEPTNTEIVFGGYTMNLSFGKRKGNKLSGRIELKVPEHKTTLFGNFVIEEPKNYKLPPTAEDAPFIVATPKLSPSAPTPEYFTAGYVGISKTGKRISNLAGTGWSDEGYASSLTFEPRVTSVIFDERGATSQHVKLEPGRYFHYVILDQGYLVGQWVDVESDTQVETNLDVDASDAGSLEVKTTSDQRVYLAPVDVLEEMKEAKMNAKSLAFSLGVSAEPENGKAHFKLLRPGKYIVVTNKDELPVEIASGEQASVALAE